MATKKFSEFDLVPTPVLGDIVVVGLDELGQNAQFPGDVFGGAAWGDITGTLADQTDLDSALNGKEDSLGNPSTTGYVLSSTDAGVRSWVAQSGGGGAVDSVNGQTGVVVLDATDVGAVVSVSGLTGTITNAQLRAALPVTDPWSATKPAGEPVVLLMFGDSNAYGLPVLPDPGLQTANANVFTWQADFSGGSPSTYNPATCSWKNVSPADTDRDPQYATAWVNFSTLGAYVGMRLGNMGMTAWALADAIQKRTGRDVYIYSVVSGGTTLKYWKDPLDPNAGVGGQKGYAALNNGTYGLTAALAAVPGLTQTTVDIVFMQDGTNDCVSAVAGTSGYTSDTFASDFDAVFELFVSEGWIDRYQVLWFNGETSQDLTDYSGRTWMGHQYVNNQSPSNVIQLSSYGLETWDTIHFSPIDLNQFGLVAAELAFSGFNTPGFVRDGNYVEQVAPVLRGNTTHSTGVMTSTITPTGGTDVAWNFNTPALADTDILFKVQEDSSDRLTLAGSGNVGLFGDVNMQPAKVLLKQMANTSSEEGFIVRAETSGGAAITATDAKLLAVKNDADTVFSTGVFGNATVSPATATLTAAVPPMYSATGTLTLNYVAPAVEQIKLSQTFNFQQNGAAAQGSIVTANTYKNVSGVAASPGMIPGLATKNTHQADAASVVGIGYDIFSYPTFTTSGGGAYTALLTQFAAGAVLTGSVTMAGRTGYLIDNATLGGGATVGTQVAFNSNVSNATNNIHILTGTTTTPTGNFCIYQEDTYVSRWNGGHRLKYRASNATSITMTTADHVLKVTTTSAGATVNLPTAVGNAGLHYIIKRTGTQTVTVDPSGVETIDGNPNYPITIADQICEIISDGANWLALHLGAP
jgi:hypothetical protein